ncbi:MAG TPA: nuclear transport factor 2 family protein [Sphingobium sp.]
MENKKKEVVLAAYDAYNARDAEAILTFVSDDVDWPDGDKRLHGRDALRQYWLNQWTGTRTHDTPTDVTELSDGRIRVRLDQIVRDMDGAEISRGTFEYFFELRDDLITRLDIIKP